MLFSQNLTTIPSSKQDLCKKIAPKSKRTLQKLPYFLKMAVFDTINVIPVFPLLKKILIKYRLFPIFLVTHAYKMSRKLNHFDTKIT